MIEPGSRLAGRYCLEELVNDSGGAALWRATDEILKRPVAIRTFAPGFDRTSHVVRAARSASRIPDSRLTQVFDADDRGPTPYVVEEWVVGQSLTDLLANGPRETEWATGLITEAAEAMASAHEAAYHHLCLTPRKLIWTSGGSIKITGTCVDAAVRGTTAENPALADAVGLGRLLYAALTAHWPGGGDHGLRPAPIVGGAPCDPSQIRAGIPQEVNDIVRRAMLQDGARQAPLRTPQEVAEVLGRLPRAVPLPVAPATPVEGNHAVAAPQTALAPPPGRASSRAASAGHRGTLTGGSSTARILVAAVAVLVLAAVVVGAWSIGSAWRDYGPAVSEEEGADPEAESEELELLTPQGVDDFDPGGGGEHGDRVGLAIDGDPETAWNTQGYTTAQFGNLKDGVGMLVDMGEPVEVHEVELLLGDGGVSYELRVGNEDDPSELGTVHQDTGASGEVEITLDEPTEGRYVLIWFTELAPDDSNYRASIHEIELRGIQ